MPKFQRIYWSKKFDWKHYAKIYDNYSKLKKNYYLQSASILVNSIKLSLQSKVIDLACGTGAISSALLQNNSKVKVCAIDLSNEMLHYYRKNFSKQIHNKQIVVFQGNAEKIHELTKEMYDAVFVGSAMWDLNIETTFKNVAKVLKKNGVMIFNLPSLVAGKDRGFIFFIEHFFRQTLNSKMIYRRIKPDYLKNLFKRNNFRLILLKEYRFRLSKYNVARFFDLLRYRYPFILFSKNMPYETKLKKCTEIFQESLRYIPRGGITESGFVFVVKKT